MYGKLILQGVSSRMGNQTDVLPAEMCRSLPERMLTKSNMATVDSSIVFDIYTTPPCAHFLMKHHSKRLFIGCILFWTFYNMAQPEEVYSQCIDSLKAHHFSRLNECCTKHRITYYAAPTSKTIEIIIK